ncbi:hypothetical protein K2173_004072 [Erythroxylum novogranatense]|uniref:RNA-polymerase II-associated protein 3-like C-terminal domain-containing protein n=1 Tax=Erythroxylum novogranatense TaxID=1862640 RepID=A0AAV8SJH4_9ROSI|nr:hypothetical protein K2173_004072 [Erythroxylum novogranatense]
MARVTSKHGRDQTLDFQGFLNDLQDWELSLKDKDKKMKPQSSEKVDQDERSRGRKPTVDSSTIGSRHFDFYRNFDTINNVGRGSVSEETTVDAASEKELGNEFFKQKKFKEAIECYSRSIALTPTALAYANRAMAYLKIRRFQEAEDDCTEALNFDDHYIKAYSRRATARKELGKFKESVEDSEFALRLEPNNQEIKKLHAEVKSLYQKEVVQKASGALRSLQGASKGVKLEAKENGEQVRSISSNIKSTAAATGKKDNIKENGEEVPIKKFTSVQEIGNRSPMAGSTTDAEVNSDAQTSSSHVEGIQRNHRNGRQELKASVQELASRAASRAMDEAARNIRSPNSAYEFEVYWRGFAGDHLLQTRLLKVMSPSALPEIFKHALTTPILIDIIKCVATFFIDDMDLAVKYLESLTKVPRFNMLVMCLSSVDKAELAKIWDCTFCSEATPIEYAEVLDNLRYRYFLK